MEAVDANAVGFEQLFFVSWRDWDGIYEVAVIVVKNEDVFVAADWRCQEAARLIGKDVACGRKAMGENSVGSLRFGDNGIVDIMGGLICFLGWSNILSLGIEVTLDWCFRCGWIFAEGDGVKARKCDEVAGIYCLEKSAEHRGK